MRNLRKALALIIIIVAAFALAACGSSGGGGGGGNGGGGLKYNGTLTAADLSNSTTAEDFASGTMGAMGTVGGPMGALSDETTKAEGMSVLRTIVRLTRNAAKQISSGGSSLSAEATQTDSGSERSPCGNGTMSYFMTLNDVTGYFSQTFTYRNYDDCSSVTNGSMSMSGTLDLVTPPYEPISMTLSLSLTMTDKASGESVTMDGSISMATSGSAMTMTVNLLFKDGTDGKVYWMNNWTATATDYGTYETIDFSGRFYHPDHGYVDFETTTPLTTYFTDENPTTGVVVYTGANNTKAMVDFNTGNLSTAYLSLDTDGDGGYDWGPTEFTL